MNRDLLVVAYYYPPVRASGTYRTASFVQHLARLGWRPAVLTVAEGTGESEDSDLYSRIPEEARVLRARMLSSGIGWFRGLVRSRGQTNPPEKSLPTSGTEPSGYRVPGSALGRVKDLLSWFLRFPDKKVGWLLPAIVRGARFLTKTRVQAIYSSGPPHTGHLVACILSRMYGVPLILDFRDPWAENPFNPLPYRTLRRVEAWLEAWVIRSASRVITVTDEHRNELRDRYHGLGDRFSVITNGFDRETIPPYRGRSGGDRMEILHAGLLYGQRTPIPFLTAVAELVRESEEFRSRVRVRFLGNSQDPRFLEPSLREVLDDQEVLSIEDSVPHHRALEQMVAADVLLLLGPCADEPEIQVPAKLFEYLGCGNPVLVLSHREGAIARILKETNELCRQVDPRDVPAIKEALRQIFEDWERTGRDRGTNLQPVLPRFDRAVLAEHLADLLARVASPRVQGNR